MLAFEHHQLVGVWREAKDKGTRHTVVKYVNEKIYVRLPYILCMVRLIIIYYMAGFILDHNMVELRKPSRLKI
jgi:hypothetical protein